MKPQLRRNARLNAAHCRRRHFNCLGVLPKLSCTVEKAEADFSIILPPPIHRRKDEYMQNHNLAKSSPEKCASIFFGSCSNAITSPFFHYTLITFRLKRRKSCRCQAR
jgi:hypothetical protein